MDYCTLFFREAHYELKPEVAKSWVPSRRSFSECLLCAPILPVFVGAECCRDRSTGGTHGIWRSPFLGPFLFHRTWSTEEGKDFPCVTDHSARLWCHLACEEEAPHWSCDGFPPQPSTCPWSVPTLTRKKKQCHEANIPFSHLLGTGDALFWVSSSLQSSEGSLSLSSQ